MERVELSQGVELRLRDAARGDADYVLLPREDGVVVSRIVRELARRGLELVDPDEIELEHTDDGLLVYCVPTMEALEQEGVIA